MHYLDKGPQQLYSNEFICSYSDTIWDLAQPGHFETPV